MTVFLALLSIGVSKPKSVGSAAPSSSTSVVLGTASSASVSAPASMSPSSHTSAAVTPQLSKVTAFEFMQAWNGLKGTTDIEQYVNVLDQIQPADITKGTSVMS